MILQIILYPEMPLYYVGEWLLLTKCACVFIVYTMPYLHWKEVNTVSRSSPIQVSNHIVIDTTWLQFSS